MKRIVSISIMFIAVLAALSSADVAVPDELSFNIFFIKRGTNSFGIYADSECTTPLSTVDFDLLSDVTSVANTHTPFYIGWTIYDEINGTKYSGGKVTVRLADTSDTYSKDLANDGNMGYGLSYTDKYNTTIGLNYNVDIVETEADGSSATTRVISVASSDINKSIVASKRSGSFDIARHNLGYITGSREVKLSINPPEINAAGATGFMSVGYSGILAVILEVT